MTWFDLIIYATQKFSVVSKHIDNGILGDRLHCLLKERLELNTQIVTLGCPLCWVKYHIYNTCVWFLLFKIYWDKMITAAAKSFSTNDLWKVIYKQQRDNRFPSCGQISYLFAWHPCILVVFTMGFEMGWLEIIEIPWKNHPDYLF